MNKTLKRIVVFSLAAMVISLFYVSAPVDGWYSFSRHYIAGGFPFSFFEYSFFYLNIFAIIENFVFWSLSFAILNLIKKLFDKIKAKSSNIFNALVLIITLVSVILSQVLYIVTRYQLTISLKGIIEANAGYPAFEPTFYLLYYLFIVFIGSLILVYLFTSTTAETKKLLARLFILNIIFFVIQVFLNTFSTIYMY